MALCELPQVNQSQAPPDSNEPPFLTIVLRGSYSFRSEAADASLEMEDLLTIHVGQIVVG